MVFKKNYELHKVSKGSKGHDGSEGLIGIASKLTTAQFFSVQNELKSAHQGQKGSSRLTQIFVNMKSRSERWQFLDSPEPLWAVRDPWVHEFYPPPPTFWGSLGLKRISKKSKNSYRVDRLIWCNNGEEKLLFLICYIYLFEVLGTNHKNRKQLKKNLCH